VIKQNNKQLGAATSVYFQDLLDEPKPKQCLWNNIPVKYKV